MHQSVSKIKIPYWHLAFEKLLENLLDLDYLGLGGGETANVFSIMESGVLAKVLNDFFTTEEGELSLNKGDFFLVI